MGDFALLFPSHEAGFTNGVILPILLARFFAELISDGLSPNGLGRFVLIMIKLDIMAIRILDGEVLPLPIWALPGSEQALDSFHWNSAWPTECDTKFLTNLHIGHQQQSQP